MVLIDFSARISNTTQIYLGPFGVWAFYWWLCEFHILNRL
jgi:hypothetical protein